MTNTAIALIFIAIAGFPNFSAAYSSVENSISEDTLIPLDIEIRAQDPAYMQTRCRDFVEAVQYSYLIETSNPITGKNKDRGEPLAWSMEVNQSRSFPLAIPASAMDFTQLYMDAFGPLAADQQMLSRPLYLRDKAACAPLFKHFGGQD